VAPKKTQSNTQTQTKNTNEPQTTANTNVESKNGPQTNLSIDTSTKPQTNTPTTNQDTNKTTQPSADNNSNLSKSGNTPKTTTTTSTQANANDWTNEEQSALEAALRKFPTSLGTERWDKIAECIPNRTKRDCVMRYKFFGKYCKKIKRIISKK